MIPPRAGPDPPRIVAPRLPDLVPVPVASGSADIGQVREAQLITARGVTGLGWPRATIRNCALHRVQVGEWDLDGARLLASRLQDPDVTQFRCRNGTWRTVELAGGRIAAFELSGTVWDAVRVRDARLGYVNLRDTALTDVVLAGCRIETLDLAAATAVRMLLDDCSVGELLLRRASLTDVDLRGARLGRVDGVEYLAGATISTAQLFDLAPALAADVGIRIG